MSNLEVILGRAGTGKTTWLMAQALEHGPRYITSEHQQMLVITRMHGARRRLEQKLSAANQQIPYLLTTIDGFALSIVNRWRTALGHQKPIVATPEGSSFADSVLGIEADFDRVTETAKELLQSRTAAKVIGSSFPLIVIDEFQDCHGPHLEFIDVLSKTSHLLLAADDFQFLESGSAVCPATEWAKLKSSSGAGTIEELSVCHRTSNSAVLAAARCLRENTSASEPTVPIICCPQYGPAAWKIVERLVFCDASVRWSGSCALISPSRDPVITKILNSCNNQLARRGLRPIRWNVECPAREEEKTFLTGLGLNGKPDDSDENWEPPKEFEDCAVRDVAGRLQRFCRLRGLHSIPRSLVRRHVEMIVHERRAYWVGSSNRTVTTVHGAKNREFENVFVLWPYKVPPDPGQQRRLLYNAITRSKGNCIVLVIGSESRAKSDPILSLLGPPQPAFGAKRKRTIKKLRTAKVR